MRHVRDLHAPRGVFRQIRIPGKLRFSHGGRDRYEVKKSAESLASLSIRLGVN
jgi:hypothetical protein